MRTDMKKVLTERPRAGHDRCYHEVRAKENRGDPDDLPRNRGMRAPYMTGYDLAKEFTDLLGPLKRFMWSCIGRRWDDVWSEICGQLSNNTVDAHLRDHVRREIDVDTVLIGGEVFYRSRFNGYQTPGGLFVHPTTGIVCGEPSRRAAWKDTRPLVTRDGIRYRAGEDGVLYPPGETWQRHWNRWFTPKPRKLIGFEREAVQVDGIWYWVVFASVPPVSQMLTPNGYRPVHHVCRDFVTGIDVNVGRYRADKKQMAGRDLRRHGLKNDL